jgi:AraC-like DNA-binding protein
VVYYRSQRDRQTAASVGHIQLIRRGQAKEMKGIDHDCSSSPSNESFMAIVVSRTERRLYSLDGFRPPTAQWQRARQTSVASQARICSRENHDPQPRLNDFVGGSTAAATQLRSGLPPHVVRRVPEHIDSNIDQRIKVKSLANLANLSVCYFVLAFKQSVGVTPRGYLTRRRLKRTMELLSGSDMSISEIALARRICRSKSLRAHLPPASRLVAARLPPGIHMRVVELAVPAQIPP